MANNPDNTIIDLREAVQVAREYFADLFSDESYTNVRLEEIALSDDGATWNLTLGYDVGRVISPVLEEMGISAGRPVREYKSFEVDTHSGIIKSMKIRKV